MGVAQKSPFSTLCISLFLLFSSFFAPNKQKEKERNNLSFFPFSLSLPLSFSKLTRRITRARVSANGVFPRSRNSSRFHLPSCTKMQDEKRERKRVNGEKRE